MSWQRVSMSDTASVTDVPDSCHSDPYVLSQTRPRSLRSLDTRLLTIRNDLFRDVLKIVIDRPMRSRCLLKIRHDLFREKCRFEASRHNAGDRLTGAGYCRILSLPAIATHDFSTQHLVPTQPVLTSTLRVGIIIVTKVICHVSAITTFGAVEKKLYSPFSANFHVSRRAICP